MLVQLLAKQNLKDNASNNHINAKRSDSDSEDLKHHHLNGIVSAPYTVNTNKASSISTANSAVQSNGTAKAPAYQLKSKEEGSKEETSTDSEKKESTTAGDLPNNTPPSDNPPDKPSDEKKEDKEVEIEPKKDQEDKKDEADKKGAAEVAEGEQKSAEKTADKEKKAEKEGAENEEKKEEEQAAKEGSAKEEVANKTEEKQKQTKETNKKAKANSGKKAAQGAKKAANAASQLVKAASQGAAVKPAKVGKSNAKPEDPVQSYAVNQQNLKNFSAGDVVKVSPNGNAIVAPSKPLANPQDKGATPIPNTVEQTENAKIQAENGQQIESFASTNNGLIAGIQSRGTSLVSNVNISVTQATSRIQIAEQQALSKLEGQINSAIASATAQFIGAIASVNSQYNTTVQKINASASKALADLDTANSDALAYATEIETSLQETAVGHMDAAIEHLNTSATTQGALAVQLANEKAAAEAAVPLEDQSRWQNFKNGSDYPANKRKARVQACKETGTRLQTEFSTQAADGAANMEANKGKSAEMISSKIAELKTSFESQLASKKSEVEASKTQSLQSAESLRTSQLDSLNSAKEAQLATLEDLRQSKSAEITQTAAQQKTQVQQVGQSSKTQLQSTLQSGVQALQQTNQQSINQLKSQERIRPSDFKNIVSSISETMNSQSTEFLSTLESSSADISAQLAETASTGESSLNELMAQTAQAISQTSAQIAQTVSGMVSSAQSQFTSIGSGAETSVNNLVQSTKDAFKSQTDGLKTALESALQQMGADVMASAKTVTDGFQSEINAIQKTMRDAAKKAEDAVQPRWKSFLKIFIDIVFAIALAVIVAALATVLGPIALIFAAIAVGAALGVGKQMLNNAIDGKPIMEGTLKAAVIGGIEGLFAAVGAGALGKIMNKGGSMLASKGFTAVTKIAGPLKNFAGKAIGKFTIKLATNVAEKVTTQIATNVMDGKSWKTDLWKATSGAVVDTFMGEAGGKLTSKVGGSNILGDAVGDSFTKKAIRKTTEVGIDFTMDTVGDGAKKVLENVDKIAAAGSFSEGLSMTTNSFVEGATTDMDDRLFKNAAGKLKDPAVNATKDYLGNRQANKLGLNAAPEGYQYNVAYDDDGGHKMDLRKTHTQNSKGRELADLTLDSDNKIKRVVTDFPEHENIKTKEDFLAKYDPEGKLPKSVTGEAYNYLRQGKKDKFEALVSPPKPQSNDQSSDPNAKKNGPATDEDNQAADKAKKNEAVKDNDDALSASAQKAKEQGLPDAPDGYFYSTSSKGKLYIRRSSKVDDEGKPVPLLRIDGDKLVEVESKNKSSANPAPGSKADEDGITLENAFVNGWTIEKVLALPKGSRPDPSEYLDPQYVKNHLAVFEQDEVVSRIVLKESHEKYGVGKPDAGKTEFISTKAEIDKLINESNGDLDKLSAALGVPRDQLEGGLVRIDFKITPEHRVQMASGNEFGANPQWIAGGQLPTGQLEAVIKTDGMQEGVDYTVTDI